MNTRRSFLKSIFAAVALSPLLCRLTTENVEAFQEPSKTVTFNPAYEDAPYEVTYLRHPGVLQFSHAVDLEPPRYNFVNGEFVRVEKHL